MAKHINTGTCPKCAEILNGVDPRLINWFKELQSRIKDAHVAWGLRGKKDQDDAFAKGNSKAKWGESPHNFLPGLAIDLFRLVQTGAEWAQNWYTGVILPEVKKHPGLESGAEWPKFKDYPHVQIRNWKDEVKAGKSKLPS